MQDALDSTSDSLLTCTPAHVCPCTPNIQCIRKDSRSPDPVCCKRKLDEFLDAASPHTQHQGAPHNRATETISAFGECIEVCESCSYETDNQSFDGESTAVSISHLASMNINTNGRTKTHGPNQMSEIDTDEVIEQDTSLKKINKINMDEVPLKPVGVSLSGSGMQLYVRVDQKMHKTFSKKPRTGNILKAKKGRVGKLQMAAGKTNVINTAKQTTSLAKPLDKAAAEPVLIEQTGDDRPSSFNQRSAADNRRAESYNNDSRLVKVCGWEGNKWEIEKSQFQTSQPRERALGKPTNGRTRQKRPDKEQKHHGTGEFTSAVNRHRVEPEDDNDGRATPSGPSWWCEDPDLESTARQHNADDFPDDADSEDGEQMSFTSNHLPLMRLEQPMTRLEKQLTRPEQPHPSKYHEVSYRSTHHQNINDNMARRTASHSDNMRRRGNFATTDDDLGEIDPRGKGRPETFGYTNSKKENNNPHNNAPGSMSCQSDGPLETDERLDPTALPTTSPHLTTTCITEFDLTQIPQTSLDAVTVAKFTEYTKKMRMDLKENYKNLSSLIKNFNQEVVERNKSTRSVSESESRESGSTENDNQRVCVIM